MLNLSPEEREIVRRSALYLVIDKLPSFEWVHESLRDRWFTLYESILNAYERGNLQWMTP